MFWRQTPRETACHLRALAADRVRAFELALFTAWHVAALSRVERMPELAPLLAHVRDGGDDDQAASDQLEAARAIVATFGTEEKG